MYKRQYQYISSIIGSCVKKARAGKETVSDKIDRIVTNRFLALPIFALIMWAVSVSYTHLDVYKRQLDDYHDDKIINQQALFSQPDKEAVCDLLSKLIKIMRCV